MLKRLALLVFMTFVAVMMGCSKKQVGQSDEGLRTILFDFDMYNIREDARGILERNAQYLKDNSSVEIQIEGHCDERGSNEYNMALGQRRANAAKHYLVGLGISANRLSTVSYGEEKPVDETSTPSAWDKNRRAEFRVVSK
ncbi:MAG: peptidoglycan-associated lipoprotein Pal [Deltaproteobacteria bacterium]|nr:peptidoglycan-associated lipoprotein Pal [Deltaproteobacteria bacterium]